MKNVEIADLHIHSRYSRATSRDGNPEMLAYQAARKGIRYVGTGDFTHPAWREELKEKLEPAEEGLYRLKKEYEIEDPAVSGRCEPRFVVSGEISSIYKKDGKTRKVHSLILLPGLREADELSRRLEAIGNIHSDGRPILGLPCRDLLEITLESCPEAVFIPAHIWTPHFSLFGAFSGFDTMEECFEDLTPYIHAVETGLSSDPPMNWTLSALDGLQLISNSDAHSPGKLGREANLLEIDGTYTGLSRAVQTGQGLKGTLEFFPEEGKYHFDGHRKCQVVLSPGEAEAAGNICPVCGKKLTMGVSHRILQLSDRKEGFIREGAKPFESLAPLPEVIGASTGHAASGKRVQAEYEKLLAHLGAEFSILREIPLEDIRKEAGERVAEGIRRLRAGEVIREPGFDGAYGKIRLFTEEELENTEGQMSFSFASPAPVGKRGREEKRKEEQPESEKKGREQKIPEGGLNPEQERAVRSESRRLAVIAGPGTGKTKTLVSRILYLIREKQIKPREITAVTFTRKAAAELEERLEKALGGKRHLRGMQIGTFHSTALKALQDAGIEIRLAENLECRELARETRAAFHLACSVSKLLGEISRIKSGKESSLIPEEVYDYYQKLLEERGLLDFDDLLLAAAEYFEGADSGRRHFSYLMVDEFQDINPVQYRLTEAWNRGGKSLFVIGDPDQSIYGFRGSRAACFQDLLEDYPETEVIRLRVNYRSTPEILGAAAAVIRNNPGGERELEAFLPSGCPVRMVQGTGELSEAIFAAREINRQVGGVDMLEAQEQAADQEKKRVRGFGEIAVLCRTHRQMDLLEKTLSREGIPYVAAGQGSFLEDPMVRGTCAFFRYLFLGEKTDREKAAELLLKQEESRMTEVLFEKLEETFRPLMQKGRPSMVLDLWMEEQQLQENTAMQQLRSAAMLCGKMEEFLQNLSSGEEGDLLRCGGKTYQADAVHLMTLHASKGLEFPVVILHGVSRGQLPLETEKEPADTEEERRLFYVGMTRAKEELILTGAGEVSRFWEEVPEEYSKKEKTEGRRKREQPRQLSVFDFLSQGE